MFKIIITACLFLTFNAFSQDESKKSGIDMPVSIFSNYSFDNLKFKDEVIVSPLNLTGYKFMIVDYMNNTFLYNNFQFDLKNIGRDISFDDINDNYRKAKLNTFDVSKDSNHFIWNMWDVNSNLQKQYQENNN
ncbi:MAG TPA: hypothetical protein DDZ39_02670 [Flavobacteriaceae bacterium]|nr:hypothetical protein [Flavobacteriaceae bacterium]HBS11086.1 hypothetical protein [Flavobacteriaceae bacterium]